MKTILRSIRRLMAVPMLFAAVIADPVSLTRYALIIGSNTGNEDRVELKYAVTDAEAVARVLVDMGGVRNERCIMVVNPDKRALLKEMGNLKEMVDREKMLSGRKEAILYYSGHADEKGLILGNDGYSYKEMRQNMLDIGVDVRIAILDACASGSLMREKGGTHRQPFLYDISASMEGHAFLTSSSSDEASQESDAIKSSFFTHYLVSGLRGPADANSDGKVTLNEAYAFAYDETLQRTEKTKAGPQHAAYDIRLKGTGDLVLTDLRTSSAMLRLLPSVFGRVFVNDKQGHLLVELHKTAGKKLEIGLDPGDFTVIVTSETGVSAADITLTEGKTTELAETELHATTQMAYRVRGSASTEHESAKYVCIPLNISLLPTISLNRRSDKTITNCSISLIAGKTDKLYGLGLSSGISIAQERTVGVQSAVVACFGTDVTGLQLSAGINYSGSMTRGLQLSSVGNYAGGAASGMQLTAGINIIREDFRLLQLAGVSNYVGGDAGGLQLAGAANIVRHDVAGLQLAGACNFVGGNADGALLGVLFNIVGGSTTGTQLAGVGNFVYKETAGLQFATVTNILALHSTGVCLAGGMNVTRSMSGLQMAGCLNVSGTCRGVQIAPFNVCGKMSGFQLGLFNICDTVSGVPLGLFTYVRKIPLRYRVFIDEAGFLQTTVRSGAEHFYSLLSLGMATSFKESQWTYGLGWGARVLTGNGYVALESMVHNVHMNPRWEENPMMHIRSALIYNHSLSNRVSVWGGPSFNVGFEWEKGKERMSNFPVTYQHHHQHWTAVWPGFVAGIEL